MDKDFSKLSYKALIKLITQIYDCEHENVEIVCHGWQKRDREQESANRMLNIVLKAMNKKVKDGNM